MKQLWKVGIGVFFGGLLWMTGVSSAASIVAQTPCANISGICVSFDNDDVIPTIRSFTFNVPRPGRVQLTFHGSLYCGSSGTPADKVIDLASQIVTGGNQVPSVSGPGGLRLATVLKDESDHAFDTSTTFSLNSVRVINYPAAGNQTVFFRIARLRMDTGTICHAYNAAFSAVITP